MATLISRERRSWTAQEDKLLREAVEKEDPGNPNPSKWHAIAKHVPNRTNKDCRKRWFAKMASDVVKGGWVPDEDERLVNAIEKYGTRWSLVASMVRTRNSDQCAKRWTDTLNPAIDRAAWTPEQDAMLIKAVEEHGKVWTKIVKTYFPGRTGLSAKNRYNSITRFNNEGRCGRNPSMKAQPCTGLLHRKGESSSSSSSLSPPLTPALTDADFSGASTSTTPFSTPTTSFPFPHHLWGEDFGLGFDPVTGLNTTHTGLSINPTAAAFNAFEDTLCQPLQSFSPEDLGYFSSAFGTPDPLSFAFPASSLTFPPPPTPTSASSPQQQQQQPPRSAPPTLTDLSASHFTLPSPLSAGVPSSTRPWSTCGTPSGWT